jgi:hypothetical protein
MARERSELGRTYPDIEIEVLICDRFDVETNCRYRSDDLTDLWAQGVSPRYLTLSLYSKVVFPALSYIPREC